MNLAILDDVNETTNAWNYFVKPTTCTVNSEDIQQTNIVRRIRIVNNSPHPFYSRNNNYL